MCFFFVCLLLYFELVLFIPHITYCLHYIFTSIHTYSLPHFKFKGGEGSLGQKMLELFSQSKNKEVASCIAEYGRVRSGGSPSLARGVARLNKRFQDMDTNFNDNPHVFEVIIDKVRHFGVSSSPLNNDTDNKNTAVSDIMKELQHEVSRRYLHIPENFKFTIGKKDLSFLYWQERLVEFSKVEIPCRSEKAWSVEDLGDDTPDSYFLRLFLGFDRYRIADPESGFRKSKKACSLYIYSRVRFFIIHLFSQSLLHSPAFVFPSAFWSLGSIQARCS